MGGTGAGRDEAGRASLREVLLRRWSGGVVVLVDESIEDSSPLDPVDRDRVCRFLVDAGRRSLVDAAVGPVAVVVLEVLDEQHSELVFVPDQGVVEEFGSGGADEAFGGGVGAWRSGWGVDHVEPGWW